MKFTKKTDYALRTTQHLARLQIREEEGRERPKSIPVQVIAVEGKLSLRFLHGIVSNLVKAGILHAVPGPKGGIQLARPAREITLLEIIEAVEGRINLMDCLEHPHICSEHAACGIMNVLSNAQEALTHSLRNTNLRLMVKAEGTPFRPRTEQLPQPRFGCPVLK